MPDHVHLCIEIPPTYAVASVIGYLKGKRAIAIAQQFAGRDRNCAREYFWARSYAVSTVGFELEQGRAYIQPETAEEAAAAGQAQFLSLGAQPFSPPRLASERQAARGEDRLRLPLQRPPRVVQEGPCVAPIIIYILADAVSTPGALLRVHQVHQSRSETEASEQPQRLHDRHLLVRVDGLRKPRGG